jgi:hypothetical protein
MFAMKNKLNWQLPEAKSCITTSFSFVLFCFCTIKTKKLNLFLLPSRPSHTHRKIKLKNAEIHFRLLIRLGDWLHTVIEYNTAVRIENPVMTKRKISVSLFPPSMLRLIHLKSNKTVLGLNIP